MKCENCTKYDDCRTGSGLTWPCGAYRPKTGGGMDIEKLIEQLRWWAENCDRSNYGCHARPFLLDAATALSTLQAENEKMRAELERVRADQEDLISRKDAVAYALSLYRKLTARQAASRTELDIGGAMVYTAGAEIAKAMACRMMELPRPQERPHGYWFDRGSLSCRCSRCGCKSTAELPECPVCGAVMDLESPQ